MKEFQNVWTRGWDEERRDEPGGWGGEVVGKSDTGTSPGCATSNFC